MPKPFKPTIKRRQERREDSQTLLRSIWVLTQVQQDLQDHNLISQSADYNLCKFIQEQICYLRKTHEKMSSLYLKDEHDLEILNGFTDSDSDSEPEKSQKMSPVNLESSEELSPGLLRPTPEPTVNFLASLENFKYLPKVKVINKSPEY